MHRPSPETSHCRRPRISISWKLFAYLTLFTTFILIVVWVFQIGLLNYFYRQSKYRELDDAEKSGSAGGEDRTAVRQVRCLHSGLPVALDRQPRVRGNAGDQSGRIIRLSDPQ